MEDKCDEIFTMKLHFQNHLAGLLHSFATKKITPKKFLQYSQRSNHTTSKNLKRRVEHEEQCSDIYTSSMTKLAMYLLNPLYHTSL
jgi:hypothetical protein